MDSLIERTGGCGCFQVCHLLCIQVIRVVNVWCVYLMVFGNYEPPWKCATNATSFSEGLYNGTTSSDGLIDATTPTEDTFASVVVHTSPQSFSAGSNLTDITSSSVFEQERCAQACDRVLFDATSATVVSEFALICDRAFIPSIIVAIQMTGMLLGSVTVGQVGEAFGRKTAIYSSVGIMSATTFVSAWSTSWEMYAAFTFFIGVGCGGVFSSHVVYAVEFLSPKWRGLMWGIPTWNLGLLGFAIAVICSKTWWHIHLFTGCLGMLTILSAFWSPESIRWLRLRGRNGEVEKVVSKMIMYNRQKQNASEVLQMLKSDDAENQKPGRQYTYRFLFQNSGLRALTIKLCFVWFAVNTGYFTLGFSVKALTGNYYTNLLLSSVIELPFQIVQLVFTTKFGRKCASGSLTLFATILTITCICVFYLSSEDVSGVVIKYLALLAKGCLLGSWMAITLFSAELFPTAVRGLAMGLLNAVAKVGGIVAAMLIPRDQHSLTIVFFILSGSLLVSLILIKTMPETKDVPMADTVEVEAHSKEKEDEEIINTSCQ